MPREADEIRDDVSEVRDALAAQRDRLRKLHDEGEDAAGSGLGLAALEWAEKEVEAAVSYLEDWLGRTGSD